MQNEMLTVEQFAERMQISETTVWNWIKTRRLQRGRHYLAIAKVVRIPWSTESLQRIMADCQHDDELERGPASEPGPGDSQGSTEKQAATAAARKPRLNAGTTVKPRPAGRPTTIDRNAPRHSRPTPFDPDYLNKFLR